MTPYNVLVRSIDVLISPAVFVGGELLKTVRRVGVAKMPISRAALLAAGVFPVRDHYYEPLFHPRHLRDDFSKPRPLPGIDWNLARQLDLLTQLEPYTEGFPSPELRAIVPNPNFGPGDADYWFAIVRHIKPKRIIEIGSGYSTRIAIAALRANAAEGHPATQLCIEPYEMPWLEEAGVTVIRKRVEDLGIGTFAALEAGDILFIDSSHVIRPQGDVLMEILDILPILQPGVIVQFHDIFSPRHYPRRWVIDDVRLWNEQYLLEAFLTQNRKWEILGSLNYLRHAYYEKLAATCPLLTPEHEPGSFYLRRLAD